MNYQNSEFEQLLLFFFFSKFIECTKKSVFQFPSKVNLQATGKVYFKLHHIEKLYCISRYFGSSERQYVGNMPMNVWFHETLR